MTPTVNLSEAGSGNGQRSEERCNAHASRYDKPITMNLFRCNSNGVEPVNSFDRLDIAHVAHPYRLFSVARDSVYALMTLNVNK